MKSFAMAAAAFASAASAQSMFEEISGEELSFQELPSEAIDDSFIGREMSALADDTSTYADDLLDRCCVVYEKKKFRGRRRRYCLEDEKMQQAFDLTLRNPRKKVGSVKCGVKV